MKLNFKIKNPADVYALKFAAAVVALLTFEFVFRIVAVDELLIQIFIFTILGPVGLYRHLKRQEND